jgi:hypothetical protein
MVRYCAKFTQRLSALGQHNLIDAYTGPAPCLRGGPAERRLRTTVREMKTSAARPAGLGAHRRAGHHPRRGRLSGRRRARRARCPGARRPALRRGVAAPPGAADRRRQRPDGAPRRGRGDAARMLRDAFLLRHGGDDPGPAGRLLVAWRGRRRRSGPALGRAETPHTPFGAGGAEFVWILIFAAPRRHSLQKHQSRRDCRSAWCPSDRHRAAQPHTYVTTPAFLTLWGLASLRDLPDFARLEDAGLLGKAPLPEELRDALGIRDDDEDEARAEIEADEDGDVGEDYEGIGVVEE